MNLYSFLHIIFCHLQTKIFLLLPFQLGCLLFLLPSLLSPLYVKCHSATSSGGLPCPSCLCLSITPLSSLFPQHLSIRTNHVTLTSVFTRVLRGGGVSTAVGRGFLPIPRGRAQYPGWLSTPRCGVPSGLQKRPHLFRAERSAQGEAICGCSALSRGYKGEQKQEGAWRGGRTASGGWADGHRSGLVHPWVWTSLGAEWCGGRACSRMTMKTLRPSAQPCPMTRWSPPSGSPRISLNAVQLT